MIDGPRAWLSRLLREPLLHFAVLGALVFGAVALAQDLKRPTVRIEAAEIEQLAAFWELQSQRRPTRDELAALIHERVDEELMAREAVRLGLDEDDVIVRRRLAQKMAFASEDAPVAKPDEATLQAYYDRNRDRYARPGRVALRHLYFSRDRTDESPEAAATAALARLQAGGQATSDPWMLPLASADIAEADIERDYGPEFAAAVHAAPVGRWVGPARSAFGLHLIRVERRMPGRVPPLAEVRDEVLAGWAAEQRREANRAFRANLRKRYKVEIAGLPQ